NEEKITECYLSIFDDFRTIITSQFLENLINVILNPLNLNMTNLFFKHTYNNIDVETFCSQYNTYYTLPRILLSKGNLSFEDFLKQLEEGDDIMMCLEDVINSF